MATTTDTPTARRATRNSLAALAAAPRVDTLDGGLNVTDVGGGRASLVLDGRDWGRLPAEGGIGRAANNRDKLERFAGRCGAAPRAAADARLRCRAGRRLPSLLLQAAKAREQGTEPATVAVQLTSTLGSSDAALEVAQNFPAGRHVARPAHGRRGFTSSTPTAAAGRPAAAYLSTQSGWADTGKRQACRLFSTVPEMWRFVDTADSAP